MSPKFEKLTRLSVPALDEILGDGFPVLDEGFVRVIDYMGGDARVVQAARVSYGAGTKKISEDEGLIRYLFRHSHSTPAEMPKITLHVRVPMDCWRQWIRHRMSNTNEYSTRYSEAIDEKQKTPPDAWRAQADANRQGSAGLVTEWPEISWSDDEKFCSEVKSNFKSPGEYLSQREGTFHALAADLYDERLKFGVAREVARKDLPLSTYTEAYWTCDLHNLLHFLSLRMDSHAQQEIREYATVIGEKIVAKWCPMAWAAFNDYNFRRDALLLSARDKRIIEMINSEETETKIREVAAVWDWMEKKDDGTYKTNRERKECEDKLDELGFAAPWTHF